jgi:arylamine N-acetyltransferase
VFDGMIIERRLLDSVSVDGTETGHRHGQNPTLVSDYEQCPEYRTTSLPTNHDSLNLHRKTNLSNRVELVNKALHSYQKSKDSIDAGPIGIVRRIEAKQAGILDKFEY